MRPLFNKLIEHVFFRGLVFNQSWEDPEIDREALQLVPDQDTILTITSGGCNSLNLLCLRPKKIICVDSNPVQTYLLDLKIAGIRQLNYDEFFEFFAARNPKRSKSLYFSSIRSALPPLARRFWDQNIQWFQRGFFAQGKLGLFLRFLRIYLRLRVGEQIVRDFFKIEQLKEQEEYYVQYISPKIWHDPLLRIVSSKLMLHLAGMHPNQYDLINQHDGIERYIYDRIEYLLRRVPIRNNYFLAQATIGEYVDNNHVPPYLQAVNFSILRRNVDRITNVTSWLNEYLDQASTGSIDKFSLLDIFDWMDAATRGRTLKGVIRVSSDKGRFIYRSLMRALPVPSEIEPMVVAEPDLAQRLFRQDRSGVYSSLHIYSIVPSSGKVKY
jgi:S-adenosylmethionine:diacylglycerol 3-amino-3-carboxypropyl transferase